MSYKSFLAAKLLTFWRAVLDGSGLTATRTYTLPDKAGTFALTSDLPTTSGDMIKRTLVTATGTLTLQSATRYFTVTACGGGASGARNSGEGVTGGAGGSHVINYPFYDVSGGGVVSITIGAGGAAKTVNGVWTACNAGGDTIVQYGTKTVTAYGAVGASSTAIANIRSRPLTANFTNDNQAYLVDATNSDYIDTTNGVIVCSPYFWVGAGTRFNTAGNGTGYAGGDFLGQRGGARNLSYAIGGGGASLFGGGGDASTYGAVGGNGKGYGAGGSGACNANSGAGIQGCVIICEYA